jgi:hypothetical protein
MLYLAGLLESELNLKVGVLVLIGELDRDIAHFTIPGVTVVLLDVKRP